MAPGPSTSGSSNDRPRSCRFELTSCSGASDPEYEISYTDGTLTIEPAALQVVGPSPNMAYGAPVLASFTPTYTGLVNGDTQPATPATCSSAGQTGSPAGTYPVTRTGAADPNYEISYVTGTLTIGRVPLQITAPSLHVTYGEPVPATFTPTYTGLVNGDTQPATPPRAPVPAAPEARSGPIPSPAPERPTRTTKSPTSPGRSPSAGFRSRSRPRPCT